jgi:glycine/D-amino acid oxidase-like deaminating enzyme
LTSDPRGLWQVSRSEQVETTPFDADTTADLAVIGGGYTGCAAALEAARRGASVCLLEANTIGHGGSGRNVGLVNAGLWLPPETVLAHLGAHAGLRLLSALAQAPAKVFELIEREDIDCEATRAGTLHLAHSRAGLRDLRERHRQGTALGAPLQLLDATETARRTGSTRFHGALFDPRAGTIQPLSYCLGLARAAQRAGATLHEHSPATAIARDGESWVITANGQTLRAKALLLATNAYHLGVPMPFAPQFVTVHYSQFATEPLTPAQRESILPDGEGCWDTALVMSSFRLDRARRFLVGGIGNATGPGSSIHAAWARRKLHQLFPALGAVPFEHAWSGRIAMTSDHIPKILGLGPSAYAAFGYSGRGIGPGTLFGSEIAASLLEGRPDVLPLAPVSGHHESLTSLRSAYYELGATLSHAVSPPPFAPAS